MQGHRRYAKLIARAAVVVFVVLASVTLLFIIEQRRTQAEMGAILSGFFSDEVLHDLPDLGAGREIQIVLQRKAQGPWGGPGWRRILLFDPQSSFAQSSRTTRASFFLSNVFSGSIQTELQLPRSGVRCFFVSPTELGTKPGDFQTRFPNNLGYLLFARWIEPKQDRGDPVRRPFLRGVMWRWRLHPDAEGEWRLARCRPARHLGVVSQ